MRAVFGLFPLVIAAGCIDGGHASGSSETGGGDTVATAEGATVGAASSIDGSGAGMPSTTGSGATTDAASDGASGSQSAASGAAGSDASASDSGSTSDESTTAAPDTGPPGDALFYEPFDAPEGSAWGTAWSVAGGVVTQEVTGGRGRLEPQTGAVGRMVLADLEELDADVTATVVFDDWAHQGLGIYVRHNGGYLVETSPPGWGYALYIEGGFDQQIGLWRENAGVEQILVGATLAGGLQPGVPYRVRLRCVQSGDHTSLSGKVWPADEAEPGAWDVEIDDSTPPLQDVPGTLTVDGYNYQGTGSVFVDDIVVAPPS